MTLTRDQIKTAALQLAPADREALTEELLLSIDETDRQPIDAAWLAEAHRRDADFLAGRTSAKPVGDVIDRLLRKAGSSSRRASRKCRRASRKRRRASRKCPRASRKRHRASRKCLRASRKYA